MKICFVINDIATEQEDYSTSRLARVAINQGHEVAMLGLADFAYHDADNEMYGYARRLKGRKFKTEKTWLDAIRKQDIERVCLEDYDVLMLRSDPADEVDKRPWAPISSLLFAQLAARRGVLVVNDPSRLTDAANKTYFQHFPRSVRPDTCISRNADEIKEFIQNHGDEGVVKPLQGSGGQGVFVIRADNKPNLNTMIEAVTRDGYALVQEYLPKAAKGDLRLMMLNGRPLEIDGVYACIHRFNETDDPRSNYTAGGSVELAEPDEDALKVAETVGPKLIEDGMYFVGLDIVGDKLLEINVDTPGGINLVEQFVKTDFAGHIIADLERKVRLRNSYPDLDNLTLAML